MSLMSTLRRLMGGPKPEDEGKEDLQAMEPLSGGAVMPGIATPEAVETAEAELGEYDAPSE